MLSGISCGKNKRQNRFVLRNDRIDNKLTVLVDSCVIARSCKADALSVSYCTCGKNGEGYAVLSTCVHLVFAAIVRRKVIYENLGYLFGLNYLWKSCRLHKKIIATGSVLHEICLELLGTITCFVNAVAVIIP